MTETALIVIDVQNDFCPGGALAVAEGDHVPAMANRLAAAHSIRVLTQDWHPADHFSFADNHPGAEPFSMVEAAYGPQVLWPRHCVQGTAGAEFHPALRTDANLIIRKGFRRGIDSYSAFYENDQETPTGLAGYLRSEVWTGWFFAASPRISVSASRRLMPPIWGSVLLSPRMPAVPLIWMDLWQRHGRR